MLETCGWLGSGCTFPVTESSLKIVREGARRMLAEALEAEVDAYIAAHAAERDENGRRLVVRNGYPQPDQRGRGRGHRAAGQRQAHRTGHRRAEAVLLRDPAAVVPQDPKITEVLPLLYLHGLSSGDFVPAPGQFLGSSAGLSPSVSTRLTEQWRAEQRAFGQRDLSGVDYVYLRADGIHVNIRLEEHKLCLLVMIGVRADGRKELIALADGYRESAESWADLLRDCARRGMRAPVLAVGDGALGFWNGLREVFPEAGRAAAGSTRRPMSWPRCPGRPTRGRRRPWRRSGAPRTSRMRSPR
jgi:Transposase, Mutator family